MGKSALVIGNGASLKGFDFNSIDRTKYDIYGCTFAFRYWLDNNWFPDYYINVDTVVCERNPEVLEFVKMNKCKIYLLSKTILNVWKDYKPNNNILFIEDVLQDNKSIFKYVKTWCSGSSAVMLAMQMYLNIKMIGFDVDYIEFLPECQRQSDGSLIIKSTPEYNPNYFFDSYQREGDIYNIPNAQTVHMKSWKELSHIKEFLNNMYPEHTLHLTNYNNKISISEYIDTCSLSELFDNQLKKNSIAFVVPCTSNKRNWYQFEDTYLHTILLPSIEKLTNDYNVQLYIGIDNDDKLFSKIKLPDKHKNINMNWIKFNDCKGNPCRIWTELTKRAVNDGYDYIQVCGDDIQFDNRIEWLGKFIKALKVNNNIGYSSGWSNNNDIPTQFLFHKTHLEIFDFVFPKQIHNWHCDDFIYGLYGKKYGNWLQEYKHLNLGGEPRYNPNDDRKVCKMLVKRHKTTLNRHINQS